MFGLFILADSDKRFSTQVWRNKIKTKQRRNEFKVAINYLTTKVTTNNQNNSLKPLLYQTRGVLCF